MEINAPFIQFQFPDLSQYIVTYGLAALFVIIAIEEAGVPLPLPGDLLIVFFGYHARQGEANPLWVILCVVISATIGSSILCGIGHRGGRPLIKRYGHYIRLDGNRLIQVEEEFQRHGIWTIVVGRLIPGFRIYLSVIAGVLGFPFKRFVGSILIASIIWATIYFSIGFLFGEGFARIEGYLREAPHMLWVIIGVVAILVATIIFFNVRRGRAPDNDNNKVQSGILSSQASPAPLDDPVPQPPRKGE